MPKIKLNAFEGLYTNIDENDTRLELFRNSVNWRHEYGYLTYEPRNLESTSLPNIETYLGGAIGSGWTWERGTFATLTNDKLATNPTAAKYDVLVLIAKKVVSGTTHRLIWIKEWPSGNWYELSRYGNYSGIDIVNHDGTGSTTAFDNSFFSTTKSGDVFFRNEKGILKIYMPHDCFWLGRINRTINNLTVSTDGVTLDQYYLDRLVENATPTQLGISIPALGVSFPNPGCISNHRLGVYVTASVKTNQSQIIDGTDVYYQAATSNFYESRDPIVTLYPRLSTGYQKYTCNSLSDGTVVLDPLFAGGYRSAVTEQFLGGSATHSFQLLTAADTADSGTFAYAAVPAAWQGEDVLLSAQDYWTNNFRPKIGVLADYVSAPSTTLTVGSYSYTFTYPVYVIKKSDFESIDWEYIGSATVADAGIAAGAKKYSLVTTMLLDEREEIIVNTISGSVSSADPYALSVTTTLPYNLNKRVTRMRYYLKQNDIDTDFLLKKEFKLLNGEDYSNFYILAAGDDTALASNIGILFDETKPSTYSIITGFKDVAIENGIGIGISSDDYVNIYYSVVGGGNLQSDLMYTQNLLPLPNISFVNALAGVNGNIAAITDKATFIVRPAEELGQLVFSINATMEYGVKNGLDVAKTDGAIIIHTKNGIFITNGYKEERLSLAIDNIIRDNYSTGRIIYNPVTHELYYKPTSSDDLYRFRFNRKVWEVLNVTTESTDIPALPGPPLSI